MGGSPESLVKTFLWAVFKFAKQNNVHNIFMYFHNGMNYDNLLILKYLDTKKYQLGRKVQVKGNSISYTIKY